MRGVEDERSQDRHSLETFAEAPRDGRGGEQRAERRGSRTDRAPAATAASRGTRPRCSAPPARASPGLRSGTGRALDRRPASTATSAASSACHGSAPVAEDPGLESCMWRNRTTRASSSVTSPSRTGRSSHLRPIRPADAPRLIDFYERLSRHSAYQRFFSVMKRLPPDWARFLATVDYRTPPGARGWSAARPLPRSWSRVARYESTDDPDTAEVAFVVQDGLPGPRPWHDPPRAPARGRRGAGHPSLPRLRARRQQAHARPAAPASPTSASDSSMPAWSASSSSAAPTRRTAPHG